MIIGLSLVYRKGFLIQAGILVIIKLTVRYAANIMDISINCRQ